MRKINKIILHCSDSDLNHHDDITVIDEWHKEKGWNKVGYHYFIKKDGVIQKGRELSQIGAHCLNYNSDSIGICLSGKEQFTEIQFRHLNNLIVSLINNKDINDIKEIEGHYHYDDNKTCPNFDVSEFKLNYGIEI